jgi:hypothetical protein
METNIIVQDKTKKGVVELSIIQSKIYEIRGVKVMLDYDLAERYGVETRALKQSVKRNFRRFEGNDFMFELTKNEVIELSRSQFVTLNKGRGSNIKYLPFAFTKLGIAMLSSVLNSDYAIDVNKNIMRAFVAIRQYALSYAELKQELDSLKTETNTQFSEICELLDELVLSKRESEKPRNPIGFKQK